MIFVSHFHAVEAPVAAPATLVLEAPLTAGWLFSEFPRAVRYQAHRHINWQQSFRRRGLVRSQWAQVPLWGAQETVVFSSLKDPALQVAFTAEECLAALHLEPVLQVRPLGLAQLSAHCAHLLGGTRAQALRSRESVERLGADPQSGAAVLRFCDQALWQWDREFSFLIIEDNPKLVEGEPVV